MPDGPDITALCSIALQKAPQAISSLEIDARHWTDSDELVRAAQATGEEDQLVESLFGHLHRVLPGEKAPMDNLTTLILKGVTNLSRSKDTWLTYLSLASLQHLKIHHCPAADLFLLQLTSGADIPALKSLSMTHLLDEDGDQSIQAIERLLRDTGNGIESLELCLRRAPRLLDVVTVAKHAGSLRTLLVDIQSSVGGWNTPSGSCVYGSEELETLLERCLQLRRLAITFPVFNIENSKLSSNFHHYTRTISRFCPLTTLSILNLPTVYSGIHPVGFYTAKDAALARLAGDIFTLHKAACSDRAASPTPSLEVIAFGTRERTDNHLGPRFFVPSEVKALGKTTFSAAQVSFSDLRKHGLATSVLSYERRDFDVESRKLFHPVEKEGDNWEGQEEGWGLQGGW